MKTMDKEIETYLQCVNQCRAWFRTSAVRTKELVKINEKLQKDAVDLGNIRVDNLLSFGVFKEIRFVTHYFILFLPHFRILSKQFSFGFKTLDNLGYHEGNQSHHLGWILFV